MKTCIPIFLLLLTTSLCGQVNAVFQSEAIGDDAIIGEGVVLPGCSWYCGGSVAKIKSSSHLPDYRDITYSPANAHDFDLATAWVEGQEDEGVGAYLEYTFAFEGDHRLGITHLLIANGYRKSEKLWAANGRVKTLAITVNGAPYGEAQLLDSPEFQSVPIGKILFPQNGVPTTIRFTITAVYPGTKYTDTAITELLFDGVGVH